MGLFKKKARRNKNEFKFIRQYLTKMALRENLAMFNELLDSEDVTGKVIDNKLRKKLGSTFLTNLKSVDVQVKEYNRLCELLDVLHERQEKRRSKMHDWVEDFCDELDAKDEKEFVTKHCKSIDLDCMEELFKSKIETRYKSVSIRNPFIEKEENDAEEPEDVEDETTSEEPGTEETETEAEEIEEDSEETSSEGENEPENDVKDDKNKKVRLVQENPDFEPKDNPEGDEILNLMNQ